jgi:hypothetical protein
MDFMRGYSADAFGANLSVSEGVRNSLLLRKLAEMQLPL